MSVRATLYTSEPSRRMSKTVKSVLAAKQLAGREGYRYLKAELDEYSGFEIQWWIWGHDLKYGAWKQVTHNEFFGLAS